MCPFQNGKAWYARTIRTTASERREATDHQLPLHADGGEAHHSRRSAEDGEEEAAVRIHRRENVAPGPSELCSHHPPRVVGRRAWTSDHMEEHFHLRRSALPDARRQHRNASDRGWRPQLHRQSRGGDDYRGRPTEAAGRHPEPAPSLRTTLSQPAPTGSSQNRSTPEADRPRLGTGGTLVPDRGDWILPGALEHAAAAWLPATSPSHVTVLERGMRAVSRVVTGCPRSTPSHAAMAEADLVPVAKQWTPPDPGAAPADQGACPAGGRPAASNWRGPGLDHAPLRRPTSALSVKEGIETCTIQYLKMRIDRLNTRERMVNLASNLLAGGWCEIPRHGTHCLAASSLAPPSRKWWQRLAS